MFEDYKDVVTTKELQTMLRIGKDTAYALLKNKKIPSIRIGKKYLIPKENVINYLCTNEKETSYRQEEK